MSDNTLLEGWTDEQTSKMHKAIFTAQHRLAELDLFGDEGLVRTLSDHPRPDLSVNTMGSDPTRHDDWREGDPGQLSGSELLEVAGHGRIWLNLRRLMDHHSQYRDLVNQLYDELEAVSECGPIYNRSANLLISSPQAMVYYHVDCPLNMLWHIRGTKRVWAYPLDSGILPAATLEAILTGEGSEEIEFQPEFDQQAQIVDLEPGQMITWPQHTPHRVVNSSGLNVSLSTEHMTREAARKNNVYLANRHFRHLFGGSFTSTAVVGFAPAAKELALRLARRIPFLAPQPPQGFQYPTTFVVDPTAPDGVRLLEDRSLLSPSADATAKEEAESGVAAVS